MRWTGTLLLIALAACTPVRSAERPGPRPSIVSLNPCADAILAEVAGPGQLLAVSHYSHDPRASSMLPEQARRFHATGGTVEELAALAPDLVVGDALTPPVTRSALARLGIGFVELPFAADIAGSKAQVRRMALAASDPAAGERLIARIDASIAAARPPQGWKPRSSLVWQGGGLVAGDGSLIAELLGLSGMPSAAAARGLGQGAILPLEAMLAAPPEVIMAAGDPRADEDRLLRHPVLQRLKETQTVRLDPTLYYCGGPSIPRALARLVEIRSNLGAKPVPTSDAGLVRQTRPPAALPKGRRG